MTRPNEATAVVRPTGARVAVTTYVSEWEARCPACHHAERGFTEPGLAQIAASLHRCEPMLFVGPDLNPTGEP